MGTLMFVCPATGIEVSTQVEMDRETLARLSIELVYCPHCRQAHQFAGIQSWIQLYPHGHDEAA
jgi:hypothetical protein